MPEPVTQPRPEPAPPTSADPDTAGHIEKRYGTKHTHRIDRRITWFAAASLLLAGCLFILFSNWQSVNRISSQDIAFTAISHHKARIKFTVRTPAMTPAACAVEALNTSKAPVGWKVIELPVTQQGSHTVTVTLATQSEATAGYVKQCWIVTSPPQHTHHVLLR